MGDSEWLACMISVVFYIALVVAQELLSPPQDYNNLNSNIFATTTVEDLIKLSLNSCLREQFVRVKVVEQFGFTIRKGFSIKRHLTLELDKRLQLDNESRFISSETFTRQFQPHHSKPEA